MCITPPRSRKISLLNSELKENEATDEYLEPTFVKKNSCQTHQNKLSFDSINEVPDETIHLAAAYLLTQAGAMTMDDLVRQASRELGFLAGVGLTYGFILGLL